MFANAASKNDHSSLLGFSGQFIQITDVLHDINNQARISEGVEVYHIPKRTVRESGTEDRYVVLCNSSRSAPVCARMRKNVYSAGALSVAFAFRMTGSILPQAVTGVHKSTIQRRVLRPGECVFAKEGRG